MSKVVSALKIRAGRKTKIAAADKGLVKMRVGVVDGLGAALFPARPDAGLYAHLPLGLTGAVGCCAWSCVVGLLLELELWARRTCVAGKISASRRARRRKEYIAFGIPPRYYGSTRKAALPQ